MLYISNRCPIRGILADAYLHCTCMGDVDIGSVPPL